MNTKVKPQAVAVEAHEDPIRSLYLESLHLVERLHRRLLDVIKDEFDRQGRDDVNGVPTQPTLVSRSLWHLVGGYSTELSPGMSSDNDFSMKMWAAGARRFVGVGASLVYHFQCKSTGKVVKNDGRTQFLRKWGMTQSIFDRYYLRRGKPVPAGNDGRLPEPVNDGKLRWELFRSRVKRALAK